MVVTGKKIKISEITFFLYLFLLSTYQNYHLLFDFDKKGRNKTTELMKNTADEISQVES